MLWREAGKYPRGGTTPEWDAVLADKQLLVDCEMFHCLPSQLGGEDYHVMERLRAIKTAEGLYLAQERKSQAAQNERRQRRR